METSYSDAYSIEWVADLFKEDPEGQLTSDRTKFWFTAPVPVHPDPSVENWCQFLAITKELECIESRDVREYVIRTEFERLYALTVGGQEGRRQLQKERGRRPRPKAQRVDPEQLQNAFSDWMRLHGTARGFNASMAGKFGVTEKTIQTYRKSLKLTG